MRALLYLCTLFAAITAVLAWTKEDHEIFDLVSELETHEGPGTTFYSWLDVPHTASQAVLNKAYRKLSIKLHPDKNPGVKGAHERYARLGKINAILKSSEGRERYNFFYKNGVPKWRGTGYYYSRFRPGLGTVLVFLTALACVLEFQVKRMNYARDLKRVRDLVGRAKLAAWGPRMVPVEGSRKVRIPAVANTGVEGMDGMEQRARTIEFVVEGDGSVWHIDQDGEQLFDESILSKPSMGTTWAPSLVMSAATKVTGKKPGPAAQENGVNQSATTSDAETSDAATATGMEKVGGKKRKANKRR
ncbi:hypothetical protein FS749_014386 [Ceratobasidium sp. UAMH 11750]|nr:hypothetical protein FS749_014386 [Ceratobasidium sp. UAMH 11750]